MGLEIINFLLRNFFSFALTVAVIFIFVKTILKHKTLDKGENTVTTTAEIISIKKITYNFIVNLYEYTYSFEHQGITYTGKYIQNSTDFKKNGKLSVSQKVLYDIIDPSKNRLEIDKGVADNKKIIICSILIVLFLIFIFKR